jgi:hypothetical protein
MNKRRLHSKVSNDQSSNLLLFSEIYETNRTRETCSVFVSLLLKRWKSVED